MENNLSEFDQEPATRPTLLTVLCILTFIGSGWSIISNIWAYSKAKETAQAFSKNIIHSQDSLTNKDSVSLNQNRKNKNVFGEKMMRSVSKLMTVDNIRKAAIGTLIASLFTLTGALMMWWLNRKGFYLYILGVIIGLLIPFYLYGGNLVAVGISSATGFFGLVFIAMYALNLKSMK